jgi:Fe-S cluster biogenesis protein NfuA
MMEEINKIIDSEIRPLLQRDGGDLEVISYENKVLKIAYQGACGGCPHATMGTLKFIEQTLKDKVDPEIVVQPA